MGRVVMPKEPMRGLKPERLRKLSLVPGIPALSLQGFSGVVHGGSGKITGGTNPGLLWRTRCGGRRLTHSGH